MPNEIGDISTAASKLNGWQILTILVVVLLEVAVFSLPPVNRQHWCLIAFMDALAPPFDKYSPTVFDVLVTMALSGLVAFPGIIIAVALRSRHQRGKPPETSP